MIYLDWAATALPDRAVFSQVREKEIECFGNPSSIHTSGKDARALIENARARIAACLRTHPEEIVFTSGGTESNNMILYSMLSRIQKTGMAQKIKVVTTGIEHPSVFEPAYALERFGIRTAFVMPDQSGIIDPQKVRDKLDGETVLVSTMMVNNETGSIQRIKEISEVIRDYVKTHGRRILFHVDAVQAFGKIRFFPRELGIDAATISCHKLGGPKGIGALFLDKAIKPEFLFRGGEQEESRRPGTENTGGCFGFALASEPSATQFEPNHTRAKSLMSKLVTGIKKIEGAVIIPENRGNNPGDENYSPYIVKAAFPPAPGEVIVRMLDEKGIAVSTGAACSSRKLKDKHRVLLNMGVSLDIANSSIRISTGFSTDDSDIDALIAALGQILPAARL
jgi:cysteine desulfurase